MNKDSKNKGADKDASPGQNEAEDRLSDALRANLKRRKSAQRRRKDRGADNQHVSDKDHMRDQEKLDNSDDA